MSENVESAVVQHDKVEDSEQCSNNEEASEAKKKRFYRPVISSGLKAFLSTHIRLLIAGLSCEAIYVFYLLRTFPLFSYYKIFTDMGSINKYSHFGLILFLLYTTLLFLFMILAWWEVYQRQDHVSVWIVFGFAGVFALTTLFVYPVTAIDLFIYIAQNSVLIQHHANSMVVAPLHFLHNDPQMLLAGGDMANPAPYGPLELYIQAIPTIIAGRNVIATLLLIKTMFAGMLLFEGWGAYKILQHLAPRLALPGALALVWNPFALFEYVANSHNDIVMTLFIVLGVWALVEEKYRLALILVTASALIKYVSAPLLPLFFIYSVWHLPTLKARIGYGIGAWSHRSAWLCSVLSHSGKDCRHSRTWSIRCRVPSSHLACSSMIFQVRQSRLSRQTRSERYSSVCVVSMPRGRQRVIWRGCCKVVLSRSSLSLLLVRPIIRSGIRSPRLFWLYWYHVCVSLGRLSACLCSYACRGRTCICLAARGCVLFRGCLNRE